MRVLHFSTRTFYFTLQGHISLFCSKTCCEQYKIQKNILAVCECCKQEKVVFETISYNQLDLFFCSESEFEVPSPAKSF